MCLISATWDSHIDDKHVSDALNLLNDWIVDQAKSNGLWNKWVYLNYASDAQDPIIGYAVENIEKLKAASLKYDPKGLFQKNVPGGYKLFK